MEYARIKSGATSATMANREHNYFVDLAFGDSCPEGFLPVEKILPKPVPADGEELCYTYSVSDGRLLKTYFTAPAGTSFRPRTFSKLRLWEALSRRGKWEAFKSWLAAIGYEDAWALAQNLTTEYPGWEQMAASARIALGMSDDDMAAVLSEAEAE